MSIIFLCLTALVHGLRNGLDLDHIAAMVDMAGTSATGDIREKKGFSLVYLLQTIKFPALYVAGHALMLFIMGFAALAFGAALPAWVDSVMERIVGATLLFLSGYLFYSLIMSFTKGQEFKLRSRWMVVFAVVAQGWHWLMSKVSKHQHRSHTSMNWDSKGAFLVGVIHGIGAETGSQMLLFASLAGAGTMATGLALLTAFTLGMGISTLAIATGISVGLTTSSYYKPAMLALGVTAAIFSLAIGLYFTGGFAALLPST